jgi:hypothetical protein
MSARTSSLKLVRCTLSTAARALPRYTALLAQLLSLLPPELQQVRFGDVAGFRQCARNWSMVISFSNFVLLAYHGAEAVSDRPAFASQPDPLGPDFLAPPVFKGANGYPQPFCEVYWC